MEILSEVDLLKSSTSTTKKKRKYTNIFNNPVKLLSNSYLCLATIVQVKVLKRNEQKKKKNNTVMMIKCIYLLSVDMNAYKCTAPSYKWNKICDEN